MDTELRNQLSAGLLEGKPLKSYKKVILGKLLLKIWDSMVAKEIELIFSGDPRNAEESVFHVYSEHERAYFERANKKHFASGMLIPFAMPENPEPPAKTFEQSTDEDLKVIINSKFLSFTSTLNKITSVAVLFRLKLLAEEMDKSNKIIEKIEARISEVQLKEYTPSTPPAVEELE
jgi:hypothetical protein